MSVSELKNALKVYILLSGAGIVLSFILQFVPVLENFDTMLLSLFGVIATNCIGRLGRLQRRGVTEEPAEEDLSRQ